MENWLNFDLILSSCKRGINVMPEPFKKENFGDIGDMTLSIHF